VKAQGPAKKPRKTGALFLQAVYYVLLAFGVFGITYAGYVAADSHTYQMAEQSKFESVSESQYPHPVIEGNTIGEMEIPRLGLKVTFVQGDTPKILRRAVGHIPGTALPGNLGNVVLTGHRDTFFRSLRNIRQGDTITLKTFDGDFQYEVEFTAVVPPSDIHVLEPSDENTLTLVTCFPFYYVGPAPDRFITRARQIGRSPARTTLAQPLRF